jgi:hypothetical protein
MDAEPGAMPVELAALLTSGKLDPALLQQFKAGKLDLGKLDLGKLDLGKLAPLLSQADPALLASLAAGTAGPAPGLSFAKPPVEPGEPLRLEIESFLDAVRTRRPPRVTARQGRAALELALEIQSTMAAHAVRAGLADFFNPIA